MNLLQIVLFPFSWLYRLITDIRNWLYEEGYKKSIRFPVPVISVGNLTVGGTGKTPHVEYLIRLLKDKYRIATLSRGYGRKTKGFLLANDRIHAGDIGDEPMQFYRKFTGQIQVAVGEKRVPAIDELLSRQPVPEVIILDDAYQHRAVQPSFSILLSDYNRPFYRDYVLPSGRLRERRAGAKRADVILVSKCPEGLSKAEKQAITQEINSYAKPATPVYFTTIRYGQPVCFDTKPETFQGPVLLVSGLANAQPLEKYVQHTYTLSHHMALNDHHTYTAKDLDAISSQFMQVQAKHILVTEKDYVKLMHPDFAAQISRLPIWYLPIEVCFLFGEGQDFNEKVLNSLSEPPK
ncbi:tetraacyldisaccharide 4'-kinase [Rhodocytophaga rosea]|uniref:Tetraacyldisaccharide 4'-kinase n=1 Tax=Rhodocytophaga rosea TaxID=2704465 RepID=A0A6C0GSY2_9BACT|nr:tetraacyldisaccharide 4'-kinase [Rhodocytophaga rosea]QHT71281.1 tetraacyldisaccharide 4'-kinase [Rhodocytophaga rosea]